MLDTQSIFFRRPSCFIGTGDISLGATLVDTLTFGKSGLFLTLQELLNWFVLTANYAILSLRHQEQFSAWSWLYVLWWDLLFIVNMALLYKIVIDSYDVEVSKWNFTTSAMRPQSMHTIILFSRRWNWNIV